MVRNCVTVILLRNAIAAVYPFNFMRPRIRDLRISICFISKKVRKKKEYHAFLIDLEAVLRTDSI